MASEKKSTLKITMLESKKEKIREMSEDHGYSTMSKFVVACVDALPFQRHLEVSQKIMHTFDRLYRYENDPRFNGLPKKDRRAIAGKIREALLELCSDAGKI